MIYSDNLNEEINITEKIKVINKNDSRYPNLLKTIFRPPENLFCLGDISLLSERCVAVVGARKVTSYGRWIAFNVAKSLGSNGIVTVSGMAYGADAEAHKGALSIGGKTIAVLGSGVDICYPSANRRIYNEIIKNGLIISELKPGTRPFRASFPMRNRIISGLSESIVIAEAGIGSGSLITAEAAIEQGRTVYAAPSNINIISGMGCNKLILDGAIPLISVNDVIHDMGITLDENNSLEVKEKLGKDELEVYNILKANGELYIDKICEISHKLPEEINPIVTVLEIKGLVGSFMGKVFIAK